LSSKGSNAVGIIVALLIVGAVASIGYYQVEVAPNIPTGTSTTTTSSVDCLTTPSMCVNVTMVSGASSPYSGYTSGSTTLYGYDRLTTTVVIGVNNTVVWINADTAFHTATSVGGDPAAFNSNCLDGAGAPCPSGSGTNTFQFTFTVPGTYVYTCIYHSWMRGTIIVLPGSSTSSTST
jgi:plastocyanin